MDEKIIEGFISKAFLSNIVNVALFDVFADKVVNYKIYDDSLVIDRKEGLEEHLEKINKTVQTEFLSNYMNAISIPKLEEAKLQGKEKIEFSYQQIDGTFNKGISFLIKDNDKQVIILLTIRQDEQNKNDLEINNEKFDNLISNLSDAMLKIYNVFDINKDNITDIKKVENYISSVFNTLTSNYPELKKSLNEDAKDVSAKAYDTLLIIDDDLVTRNMIKRVFQNEYKIVEAKNGKEALDYLKNNKNKDVTESTDNVLGIFLDLTMPVMDGFAVLEYLSKNNYLSKIPVIIISGDYEKETKARVYNYNIADMLEKPFDFQIVKHRVTNFINLYKSSTSLGDLVSDQSSDLKGLVNPLVSSYEYDYRENISRINKYISILAEQIMNDHPKYNLEPEKVKKLADASRYYDIGFYSIPRTILSKKEKLTEDELQKIRKYPLYGAEMIKYVLSLISDIKYKEYAINIAKYYHENYDGTGYPEQLLGDSIPLEAQIASIAIMYNSLYKRGKANIKEKIISKSGTVFNPLLIESFKKTYIRFQNVK